LPIANRGIHRAIAHWGIGAIRIAALDQWGNAAIECGNAPSPQSPDECPDWQFGNRPMDAIHRAV
jgi:hypothetical protein